jgi:hypothetical protein
VDSEHPQVVQLRNKHGSFTEMTTANIGATPKYHTLEVVHPAKEVKNVVYVKDLPPQQIKAVYSTSDSPAEPHGSYRHVNEIDAFSATLRDLAKSTVAASQKASAVDDDRVRHLSKVLRREMKFDAVKEVAKVGNAFADSTIQRIIE